MSDGTAAQSLWQSPQYLDRVVQEEALSLLSYYLGLEGPSLIESSLWLLDHHGEEENGEEIKAFIRFFIPKKSGGRREILAPVEPIKGLLRIIAFELLSRYPLARFAHGFRKNRSAITNARVHFFPLQGQGRAYGINWDIQDCFPTTDIRKIVKVFQRTIGDDLEREGVDQAVIKRIIRILVNLTTFQYGRAEVPVLPMGAPTSPALLNLVLRPFDLRMAREIKKIEEREAVQLTYTRYGDDISITSPNPLPSDLLALGPNMLRTFGYRTNRKKTTKMMRGGSLPPIEVTGLIICRDKLILSEKWLKETEKLLIIYLDPTRKPGKKEEEIIKSRLGHAFKVCGGLPGRLKGCIFRERLRNGIFIQDRFESLARFTENINFSGDASGSYTSGSTMTEEDWGRFANYIAKLQETDPEAAEKLWEQMEREEFNFNGSDYIEPQDLESTD